MSKYCTVLKWNGPPFGFQEPVFCSNPLTGPQAYRPIMPLLPRPPTQGRFGSTVAWWKEGGTRKVGHLAGVGAICLFSHSILLFLFWDFLFLFFFFFFFTPGFFSRTTFFSRFCLFCSVSEYVHKQSFSMTVHCDGFAMPHIFHAIREGVSFKS